jgi:hypothetical protein
MAVHVLYCTYQDLSNSVTLRPIWPDGLFKKGTKKRWRGAERQRDRETERQRDISRKGRESAEQNI